MTLSNGGVKVFRNNSHQLQVMCKPHLPTAKKKEDEEIIPIS